MATFDLTACLRLASDRQAKSAEECTQKTQKCICSRSDRVVGKFDVMATFALAQKVALLCHQNQLDTALQIVNLEYHPPQPTSTR